VVLRSKGGERFAWEGNGAKHERRGWMGMVPSSVKMTVALVDINDSQIKYIDARVYCEVFFDV